MNPFYDNLTATTSEASATCAGSCASIMLKIQPCVLAALKFAEKKVFAPSPIGRAAVARKLLDCTIQPSQICACADCMPESKNTILGNLRGLGKVTCTLPDRKTATADEMSPYVDLLTLADSSIAMSAFRVSSVFVHRK